MARSTVVRGLGVSRLGRLLVMAVAWTAIGVSAVAAVVVGLRLMLIGLLVRLWLVLVSGLGLLVVTVSGLGLLVMSVSRLLIVTVGWLLVVLRLRLVVLGLRVVVRTMAGRGHRIGIVVSVWDL